MLQIKPLIEHESFCENCKNRVQNKKIMWQGIHVCVFTYCNFCSAEYIEDLKVGHATYCPYKIRLPENELVGDVGAVKWLGLPFRQSLQSPSDDIEVKLSVRRSGDSKRVVIINCIDYLYGHSLLKLLNAQREYKNSKGLDVVVIVQTALEWVVPDFVAEVWTVNIPFKKARNYYPSLNKAIEKELERFDEVYVSYAYSHPSRFEIENFTGVSRYDSKQVVNPKITFIWREDRLWMKNYLISKAMQKYPKIKPFMKPLLHLQKWKVIRLFKMLKNSCPPGYTFTVAGLGKNGKFKDWIQDERVAVFDKESERRTCQVYSESEIVIGVHGSNMLLPSAHARMTLDLMPQDRWGNFAQDLLFQEPNNRLSSFKYRLLPIETKLSILSKIIKFQINGYEHFSVQMMEDNKKDLQTVDVGYS